MKFSIITASFNSSKTISDCLSSIFNQTHTDIEHIVIDGGSTDNSLDIISSVPNRVTKLISETDYGIYDAINKGIRNSDGDIIGLLHSDDVLASDTIIKEVNDVFTRTSADIVYGDLNYVSNKDINIIVRHWKSNRFDRSFIKKGWMPAHPTMFVRKNIFMKFGAYNLQYHISSDYDFMLRIMLDKETEFEYLPEVITKMRTGGVSNRNLRSIFLKSFEDYRIMKKNQLRYPLLVLVRKNFSKLKQFIN